MSLDVYKEDMNPLSIISDENPLFSVHDSVFGESKILKVYLRNSNSAKYYTDVYVSIAFPDGEDSYSEGGKVSPNGIMYQLIQSTVPPTIMEWKGAPYTNEVYLETIDDTDSYIPFYIRVYSPASDSLASIEDAVLRIRGIERVV